MRGFYASNIRQLPPDPLFGLKARFAKDARPTKVDLGIGAYRDSDGKPWILPSVRLAEDLLQHGAEYNHEYLPITGLPAFTAAAAKVILGADSPALAGGDRLVSVQSLSGTGALHVAGVFLRDNYKEENASNAAPPTVYLSDPTWANHTQIFRSIGVPTAAYPYWDAAGKTLDLHGWLDAIAQAPRGSVFLLHATAHNPTGLDPTREQWRRVLSALSSGGHLPLFDSAYQGFSSGSLAADAWAVREAVANTAYAFPAVLVCQSFAKNMGLYGERVGAVHVVLPESADGVVSASADAVRSQLAKVVRSELSNPPAYGAKVAATILNTPQLYAQWEQDLVTMSARIGAMRQALVDELTNLGTPGDWSHITKQQGMFSFTGLSAKQVATLEEKHGVYLVGSGRASIAGLNSGNVAYVARCIDAVVRDD